MVLGDKDFGLLQQNIDALMERLARLRLSVTIERDFHQLVTFLRANRAYNLNPTFNPDCSDLSRDSFWLRVVDDNDEMVASHAQRMFITHDICDLVETGRLWYDDGLALQEGQNPLVITPPSTLIAGSVAHAGGLWVQPAYRKRGLSLFLPFLSRALCLRNYAMDFMTCIVLETMGRSKLPKLGYGYCHVEPFAKGWIPPVARNDSIYICYMSAKETMEQFRWLPDHPLHPVPLDPFETQSEGVVVRLRA
jgi:hypothetical protein